jgi:hypothetical protein
MPVKTIVQPQSGQATVQATFRVVANFGLQHLKAAALFRNHVVRIETQNLDQGLGQFLDELRSYGSACILSSVAALEALINELSITPEGKLRELMPDFEKAFMAYKKEQKKAKKRDGGVYWVDILEKYQYALTVLSKPKLDETISPYVDALGLIELRNALVHYKPAWGPDRQRQIDLAELLEGLFELSPLLGSGSDLISMKCMSAGCMQWAVGTVRAFVSELDSQSQLDPDKLGAFASVGT